MSPALFDRPDHAPPLAALLRWVVGVPIFFSEGVQKLLYPADLGAGRFAAIGIPYPEVMGPFVGATEIACGLLLALGWRTRLVVLPLIAVMVVALITTKLPILLGQDLWGFQVRSLPRYGLLSALHEARTDLLALASLCLFLAMGGGRPSVDGWLARRHQPRE